ncbi:hypothetical protein K2173_013037 [Erythroxylum novogranatense]|uniref:DYW domain-containing protein n=1 Tax=Erythroxylum novogranatense TaxID=1862640 RepID=A0AAV8S729_9ROSI|nr:hypothetical protein K2173_013037 [Erythroxylum novogranatense]
MVIGLSSLPHAAKLLTLPNNCSSRHKHSSSTLKPPNTFSSLKHRLNHHINGGQLREAISTLDLMSGQGSHPDLVTYSLLLKSCIRSHNFRLGKLVHDYLTRSLLEPDSVLLNSLISLYSKCGEWDRASEIFEDMDDKRDLVSWSALISCYANNGLELKALSMFIDMLELGFYPNEYCYTAAIRACSNRGYVSFGEIIFGSVIKTGFLESDVCVGCALIDMFIKGRLILSPHISTIGLSKRAIDLFLDMLVCGYVPDRFTLSGAVSASAELGPSSLGQQLHSWIIKKDLTLDVCVGCSLIDMYAKCASDGSVTSSRKVFDRMLDHNVMSWTAIISAYVQSGADNWEAIELFCDMIQGPVKPNHFTFSSILKACANLLNPSAGEHLYSYAVKMGFASVNCVGNSLISMYTQCGDTENARKALTLCLRRICSNLEEAFDLSHELEDTGIEADAFTFASLLSGASSIGAIGKGDQIHARVLKLDLKSNLHISNALISMYSRCGDIDAAFKVFNEIRDRNVISWTSMVTGFAKHGFAARALETFCRMSEAGVRPNEITYIAVLSACSHVGLISEGWKHFDSMTRDHGIVPRMEHYACMVDLLGRSGHLDEAMDFINSMPFKAGVLILRTFLGACRVHRNRDLGMQAAKMILEQDPNDPAAYVLLSNLYASVGQWDDVADIRKSMQEMNLIKEAGCSWMEVDNKVHRFYVADTAHPRAVEIYRELDQLVLEIKELGYVPDTDLVLHEVEEEHKEHYLFQHSEKIAVAFGLISTGRSKPIRVFKNLRVCGDCHTAMKYMSMARGREIVLRDSNRFHHFKDGACSCNDYW